MLIKVNFPGHKQGGGISCTYYTSINKTYLCKTVESLRVRHPLSLSLYMHMYVFLNNE